MAPVRFDRARVEAFLALAAERLDGEWLLIGGGAAAAWFAPTRTTDDLDMIGLGGTQAERFRLMELAVEAAIPIDELVVLVRGSATIYRPSATLFLLLKLGRLSATDLDDCLTLIPHSAGSGEAIDRDRVLGAIGALAPTEDALLQNRRERLARALGSG